jgi:hypothetical protein
MIDKGCRSHWYKNTQPEHQKSGCLLEEYGTCPEEYFPLHWL